MPGVSTTTKVSGNNLYIDFPTQLASTPFKDVRVRQAAAYAVDMDAIIKRVLFGQGQRYAEIALDETGYDPALKPYPFDPAKRTALLHEIARKKHEEVLGGLTTYRPLVTLAWRTDKVAFTPWPWPGAWHDFQQISIKSAGAQNG